MKSPDWADLEQEVMNIGIQTSVAGVGFLENATGSGLQLLTSSVRREIG